MKIYKLREVTINDSGDITIIHSKGAFFYQEEDVVHKEYTNSFFSWFNIGSQSCWQRVVFWNWVLSIGFGLYFLIIGIKFLSIPFPERRIGFGELIHLGSNHFCFLIPVLIFSYVLLRCIYFILYRDFFTKDLIYINLKSNKSILLRVKGNKSVYLLGKNILERIFNKKSENKIKLKWELISAILIYSFAFYLLYSSWGKNEITSYPDCYNSIQNENKLTKKDLYKLTTEQQIDYHYKSWVQCAQCLDEIDKWENKYKNEHIPLYYFFALGYFILLPIAVIVILVLLVLIG